MIKRELFFSDIHWPHHSIAAWHVTLKVIADRDYDLIHLGGDGVDFHSISRHPKELIERTILKHEVTASRRELARLRKAAPNAAINFQEGNHDARMQIYLRDRAPELSELFELTFPKLMQLDEVGVNWIPETEKYRVGKLYHHHGHLLAGGGMFPAKNKFVKVYQNIIFGHHHRFDYFAVRQYGSNELFQSIANANLYGLDASYAHQANWQLGFTEVDYIDSGDFSAHQVHITLREDGSAFAIVGGKLYEGHPDEDIDRYLSRKRKAAANRK